MGREWKPGDVAMVSGAPITFFASEEKGGVWWTNTHGYQHPVRNLSSEARPLVVIDPEDREQVERLVGAFRSKFGWASSLGRETSDAMQAALRSLVAPPKPDEPMGLGAVVEDAEGRQFVRISRGLDEYEDWKASTFPSPRRRWSQIAAVRVLSEGVA